jgi:peptidyl-dipeptidase Dcp
LKELNLNVEQLTLLEDTYNEFKNNGATLKGADREEFKKLKLELSELGRKFSNNLTNSAGSLKYVVPAEDKDRLDGIPQDIINSYAQNAKADESVDDNAYVITMTPPPTMVFEYANDRSLRAEVHEVYKKVGAEGEYDNTQVVLDILDRRHRLAKLLGFENHADKTIRKDTRMAENYQTAMDFVKDNVKAYYPVAKKFYDELKEFAKDRDGITDLKVPDRLYYIRLMREDQIGYDPAASREYFELENTLGGLFEHAEKLYGITVTEDTEGKYPKQHEDVRNYEIRDAKTGEVKALYFLDPYARKDKNSGAWMNDVRNAGLNNGKMQIPIAGNYCNYNKPSDGEPTLLTDSEVETLWHEFGHACHGMMGKGEFPGITGINTPWDYVELPSQINECWAFKPEVIATYATHYEDDTKIIPQDLVDKLQKLAAFDAKWQGIRQSELGLLDMVLHTTDPSEITDLKEFQDKVWKATELMPWEGPAMVLNFGHIMAGGYSAGYYSYKWADALVADVFEQFEKKGIYDKTLCDAFKELMIEPGGTRAPSLMHKDFMEVAGEGRRDLDSKAMFRREGLAAAPKL